MSDLLKGIKYYGTGTLPETQQGYSLLLKANEVLKKNGGKYVDKGYSQAIHPAAERNRTSNTKKHITRHFAKDLEDPLLNLQVNKNPTEEMGEALGLDFKLPRSALMQNKAIAAFHEIAERSSGKKYINVPGSLAYGHNDLADVVMRAEHNNLKKKNISPKTRNIFRVLRESEQDSPDTGAILSGELSEIDKHLPVMTAYDAVHKKSTPSTRAMHIQKKFKQKAEKAIELGDKKKLQFYQKQIERIEPFVAKGHSASMERQIQELNNRGKAFNYGAENALRINKNLAARIRANQLRDEILNPTYTYHKKYSPLNIKKFPDRNMNHKQLRGYTKKIKKQTKYDKLQDELISEQLSIVPSWGSIVTTNVAPTLKRENPVSFATAKELFSNLLNK